MAGFGKFDQQSRADDGRNLDSHDMATKADQANSRCARKGDLSFTEAALRADE